ncbi:MAG TPA: ABC transporter ATP-binding protein [Devosiaceae bacterium]
MTRPLLDIRADAFSAVLRFTFGHWRHQPWMIQIIVAAILLATVTDVLTPLYAGHLVDAVTQDPLASDTAWQAAVGAFVMLMVLGLGAVAMRQVAFLGITFLTTKMMTQVARDAFFRVQRFSTDWHASSFAGSTVRKITRGMWALDLLNDTLLLALLPSVVMLVGSTLLLGFFWPVMGLTVAIGSLIYVGLTVALSVGWVAPAASLANAWDTRVGGALADAVSCNAVVKAFGAEAREDARLDGILSKWLSRTRRTWIRGTFNGGVQGVTMLLLRASILAAALILWRMGLAGAGDLAFVLTTFFVLQGYLRDIGMHIRNLQRSVNDMEELVAIHAEPIGIADRDGARPISIGAGRIEFRDVLFQYKGHETPLYAGLSVTIEAGQRVGLVGHSGSGKTTFVKMIQRLYDVNGGAIMIDGQDIALAQQSSLRAQIAIVPQEPILFHRTLAENIAYARPGASRADIEAAARLASAHGFIAQLPKGYETLVGERGVKLSGGERQRVAIARAFLADAPILILDEATSSLDSESEVLIQEAMERLMQGRTTLIIAHRLATVRSLDRLLVFDKGRIVEDGNHETLLRQPDGIYRRLFETQALDVPGGLVA